MLAQQEYMAAVARYLDMVYRPACSSLSLAAGAEDATQETIEKIEGHRKTSYIKIVFTSISKKRPLSQEFFDNTLHRRTVPRGLFLPFAAYTDGERTGWYEKKA